MTIASPGGLSPPRGSSSRLYALLRLLLFRAMHASWHAWTYIALLAHFFLLASPSGTLTFAKAFVQRCCL